MKFISKNSFKAFTLVEIIVVLIIVAVLAAIAIPNFTGMTNRAYAQDAMRNLMAIYAAQVNYAQNSVGGVYCIASCNSLSNIDTNLGLNIVSSGGTTYNCSSGDCIATSSSFTMQLVPGSPVNVGTVPVYCGSGSAPYPTNPCCSGGAVGATCPST